MDLWSTKPHENHGDAGGRMLFNVVGRRGRHGSGEVETAGLSDPERAYGPMIMNRVPLVGTREHATLLVY